MPGPGFVVLCSLGVRALSRGKISRLISASPGGLIAPWMFRKNKGEKKQREEGEEEEGRKKKNGGERPQSVAAADKLH